MHRENINTKENDMDNYNYCYNCMEPLDENGVCQHCHTTVQDNIVYRLKPGTILNNKFLVGRCLGEGGFGITYIGRDLTLDIKVAIKEYYPNGYVNRNNTVEQTVAATTENQKHIFNKGKERFLEEARKVAKFLGEPGVVGVREYFEANGTAYIIMEFLEGENLAAYIKKHGTFDANTIFRLMLPITSSLKRVHDAGLIHRDISPDNIMYMSNGRLKLMDFGSARYYTNEQKEMSVLLKQGYAPEEQYRKNGKQGPWTDVYGLSATIYRCITGSIPEDALDRLRHDDLVPPSQMGVNIPPALENILLYGLAVFRENRCQNMEEFSSLIELALYNPQEAEAKTAALVPGRKNAKPQDDQRTTFADDTGMTQTPPTGRPLTGNPSTGYPVTNTPQTGNPTTGYPYTGNPVTNTPQTTPPKKKKTGLIIGLAAGGAALVVLIIVLVIVFSGKGSSTGSKNASPTTVVTEAPTLDGSYKWVEYQANGEDLSSLISGQSYILTINQNKGTMDVGTTHYDFVFDPDNKTVSFEGETIPYTLEGNKLTLEESDTDSKMGFEKQ